MAKKIAKKRASVKDTVDQIMDESKSPEAPVNVTEVDTSLQDEQGSPAAPVAAEEAPASTEVPVVAATTTPQADTVQFVLIQDISPAPRIGTYVFEKEMRISKLVKGNYSLPRHVAEVLQDKKLGHIIG